MATWLPGNSLLTDVGMEILIKVKAGIGAITVTRVAAGSGRVSSSSLSSLMSVSGVQKPMTITKRKAYSSGSEITVNITNTDYSEEFPLNQIGVYVTHPDFVGEQLYHITQCEAEGYDLIPASTSGPSTLEYTLYMMHGNSSSVNITVNPQGTVSSLDFEAFKSSNATQHQELVDSLEAFRGGIREGKLITVDAEGNLVASGKTTVSGYPITVTNAIDHRALSLSIEGNSTQATPKPSTPVYPVDCKILNVRSETPSFTTKAITFPTPIVLRSLGDYKDTIEWDGAKWWKVQRIQEVVMDGTTNRIYSSSGSSSATYCRYALTTGSYKLIQDHVTSAPIQTSHGNATFPDETAELYAYHWTSNSAICCHILNTISGVTSSQSMADKGTTINAWLKAQYDAGTPLKVRYVLKTPVVTEISISDVLVVYSTKTDLSCSYEGNIPYMRLGYALNTTDATIMYILNSLTRKSEVTTANTFAVATIVEE